MTRLERVIETVKRSRHGTWIYDEHGNIKDDVVCCDILPYLEELKGYEIEVTDEYIKKCLKNPETVEYYTYNYRFNVDKDLVMKELKTDNGHVVLFCVHVGADARAGFTDYFVCEFLYEGEFFSLESAQQYKYIENFEGIDYAIDMNIFSETYNVYSCKYDEYILNDFDIDLGSLLGKIHEEELRRNLERIS